MTLVELPEAPTQRRPDATVEQLESFDWAGLRTCDEGPARAQLRAQIGRLERLLAAEPILPAARGRSRQGGGLLDLDRLERVRDELVERLSAAREVSAARARDVEIHRRRLEEMLLAPHRHRWERVMRADLGLPGCGAYHVRPRLGLVGMLAGWWQVKLSSGCP